MNGAELATEGIKPVGPLWPARPAQQNEHKQRRRDRPRPDEDLPDPPRGDDDDRPPTLDEYAHPL